MGLRAYSRRDIRGSLAAHRDRVPRSARSNVTWLWTLQADERGTGPIASWWPGEKYVTWVGIDGYYYHPSETFFSIFGKTIAEVRALTGLAQYCFPRSR